MDEHQQDILENLVLSQIIKNPYYRDKVLTHLRSAFFEDSDHGKMFDAIHSLVIKDGVGKLDRKTIGLKYKKQDKIDEMFYVDDYPTENVDKFLIPQTEEWGKIQALKEAIVSSATIINDNKDTSIIYKIVTEALAFQFDSDIGLNYNKDIALRFAYYRRADEKLTTGWDMLDYYTNGGLPKKTLTVALGPSNVGKTLLGTNLIRQLIERGYSGIYLTLEMARELIARRVDSAITKIPYYQLPFEEEEATKRLKNLDIGQLYIREYPPSKACTVNIKTYLKELELIEKHQPDFIAIDYIQLMKPNSDRSGMNSYDKYKEISEELREMAVELNIPVITFSQVRREGYSNDDLNMTHVSDSMGIINTSDLVIAMIANEEVVEPGKDGKDKGKRGRKKEKDTQTWRIIKSRLGKKGVEFKMAKDDDLLRFDPIIDEDEKVMIDEYKDRESRMTTIEAQAIVTEVEETTEVENAEEFIRYDEDVKKANPDPLGWG